jgi:hypothetical protein
MTIRPAKKRLTAVVTGLAVTAVLASSMPASASTTPQASHLSGVTKVSTAPGIVRTLIGAGVAVLPVATQTRFAVSAPGGRVVESFWFPITGGNPNLKGPSGDIDHAGGIQFVGVKGTLELAHFDIDLKAGKIYATEVNHAKAKIAVLDLDLSKLKVKTTKSSTTLSGIALKLDPAAAGALNATYGLALPVNGSLVFGYGMVTLG